MVSGSLAALRAKQATTDLTGKVAVVVGGTSGIGEGCAMRLAESKADVVIVGRSETHGQEILKQLKIKRYMECSTLCASPLPAVNGVATL